jgi:hypothetical protein
LPGTRSGTVLNEIWGTSQCQKRGSRGDLSVSRTRCGILHAAPREAGPYQAPAFCTAPALQRTASRRATRCAASGARESVGWAKQADAKRPPACPPPHSAFGFTMVGTAPGGAFAHPTIFSLPPSSPPRSPSPRSPAPRALS